MTRLALKDKFSPHALKKIFQANIYQDRLCGQVGHAEYHFDDSAFEKSYTYMEEQRAVVASSLAAKDAPSAWAAFGRLTHTVQDFYSHSNYVDLWLAGHPEGTIPAPYDIDPMEPNLIHNCALYSGKIYPLDYLAFFPLLRPLVVPLLPRDSHAWMNLDSSNRGPKFKYAFQAAIKRTRIEFESTAKVLPENLLRLFIDQ